ncbi:glycosyltransferase family 1 protein, partial [Dehalococcoides mccartyi]|nr:glycosyltransferase family 1 protein [Dehalococcoides mccartyi]
MKILFVGVMDVEWSTNLEMKRGLEQLGHEVDDFNYRSIATEYDRQMWPFNMVFFDRTASAVRRVRWLPSFVSNWYWRRAGRGRMRTRLLDQVKTGNYDLVLFAKTDTLHFEAISEIGEYCATWFYFMDPSERSLKVLAPEYAIRADWSSASSSDVTNEFRQFGAKSFHMIQGIDTIRFKSAPPASNDVIVFAGTRTPDREIWIDQLTSAGYSVKCFGHGWELGPRYAEQLVEEYHNAAIVLNFCQDSSIFSVRVPQAMACGAFVLSQKCNDLVTYFDRSEHLDWFETPEEMIDKVGYYLSNKSNRFS